MALTRITSDGITDAAIVNADINASAAIAGTKISPDFGSQAIATTGNLAMGESLTLTGGVPHVNFIDNGANPDWQIGNINGVLRFQDTTAGQERMVINTDGHIDVLGNLDVGAGIDVTGAITGTGDLTIDTNTLHVDSSNNRVGIGTTSPDRLLDVSGTGNVYGKFQSTDTTGAGIEIKDSSENWLIQADGGSVDGLAFYDLGRTSYRAVIDDSGNLGINTTSPTDKLDVNGTGIIRSNTYVGGNIYMYGGSYTTGIFLGGSGESNRLHDYEEGTWTPIIRAPNGTGVAGTGNAGFYTKVGNVVHAHATVHWTSISGTTSTVVQIMGLPFSTKNVSNYRSTTLLGGQIVGVHNGNDDGMNIAIGVDANQSFVYVTGVNGSVTASYNYTHTPTVTSAGQIFGFAITYLT
jgi:hypothetical protein